MTPEQKKELSKIGKKLAALFPAMFASVKFNLRPGRKYANVNFEQHLELKE